jgi:hypothetical protein
MKKSKRQTQKPSMTVKRFPDEHAAMDYADNMAARLRKNKYNLARPRGNKGVSVVTGIKRPAVLIVTPKGKVPRISQHFPHLSPKMPKLR